MKVSLKIAHKEFIFLQVNGKTIYEKEKDFIPGPMELNTKVNGKQERKMDEECSYLLMVINMKEIGMMEREMERE